MTKFCESCHTANRDRAKYCSGCAGKFSGIRTGATSFDTTGSKPRWAQPARRSLLAPSSLPSQAAPSDSIAEDDLVAEPARTVVVTADVAPRTARVAPTPTPTPASTPTPGPMPAPMPGVRRFPAPASPRTDAFEARAAAPAAPSAAPARSTVANADARPSVGDARATARSGTRVQASTAPAGTRSPAACDRYNPFGEAPCFNSMPASPLAVSQQFGGSGAPPGLTGFPGAAGSAVVAKGSATGGTVGIASADPGGSGGGSSGVGPGAGSGSAASGGGASGGDGPGGGGPGGGGSGR